MTRVVLAGAIVCALLAACQKSQDVVIALEGATLIDGAGGRMAAPRAAPARAKTGPWG